MASTLIITLSLHACCSCFYGKKPFPKALWTEARHLWKTSDLRIHSHMRCICCISTVSFLDLCPTLPQGNQWRLPNYGTSGSVNGSEGNHSFCDSKIFAHCFWEPPTSEVAAKLMSRSIWICLESPQKLDCTTISRNTHKVTTFHLHVVTFQITPTQKQKALNYLNSTNTWKAHFLPNMSEKHICIKLCLHQLQKPMENVVVPFANPKDKLAWQKGCSLRKGDAFRQTSCSRPCHVEGHRQWELGTSTQDLIVQLYFPAQGSLLSASQPNKWTWQISKAPEECL